VRWSSCSSWHDNHQRHEYEGCARDAKRNSPGILLLGHAIREGGDDKHDRQR
jgi:hypothetical protein